MAGTTTTRIVCLANSRKRSGRCIAGKEILSDERVGDWIRPVSDRPDEEVSEYERQYEDGRDPVVLDVIEVPLIDARPKNYQQENWLLDPDYYWEKVDRTDWDGLHRLVDPIAPLWANGHSTSNGFNDRIPIPETSRISDSLRLIRLSELELEVSAPGLAFGNRRRSVQGRFRHDGMDYWLRVTDPKYERLYLRRPNGIYHIRESFLTISLGEAYRGHAYKLSPQS